MTVGPEIRTERLLLRRWRPDDLEPYAAICADPVVMRWIWNGSTRSRQDCAAAIERFEAGWNRRGFGLFAIELSKTGEFIGFAGLAIPEFLPEIMPAVEIGWRLARECWGRGLATEGATAALRFGFETAGLERIVGIVQVGNAGSARIAAKLGMALDRETVDPSCGRWVRVYEALRR